jgi:circadian clock protein KaiC
MEIEKVQTHIDGFDEVLGGGVPRGSVVLVEGLPGTMKSTFGYSILHSNAQAGLNGLYVTLEQSKDSLTRQMATMGFQEDGIWKSLHFLDVGSIQKRAGKSAVWMDFLRKTVTNKMKIERIDLLVIDSLEALEVLAEFQDRRRDLYRLFEWLRDLEVTSFLITEGSTDEGPLAFLEGLKKRDEGYLADGIIQLWLQQINELDVQRRIRCQKMRSTHHKTGSYALVFEDGKFSVTRAMSA